MRILHRGPRAQPRPLALLALAGFTASFLVHVLSYAGIAAQEFVPAVWGLHVGIFVVFIPFVVTIRRFQRGRELEWRTLLAFFPRWIRLVVPALFVYVTGNFFLAIQHLPTKGEAVAEYSARVGSAAVAAKPVFELRAFSGHWLIFYLLPALYFLYVPASARLAKEGATDAEVAGRQAAG